MLVVLGAAAPALGQSPTGGLRTDGTSYHVFARPGQNTVQVLVLGDVSSPGVYEVGEGTDLARLLALSGGPGGRQRSGTRQETTIRLYRPQENRRELLYEANLERMVAEPGPYPALQRGDVLQVKTVERERFSWRDGLRIFTALGTLAIAVERLSRTF